MLVRGYSFIERKGIRYSFKRGINVFGVRLILVNSFVWFKRFDLKLC